MKKTTSSILTLGAMATGGGVGYVQGEANGSPVFVKPPLQHESPQQYAEKVCREINGKVWMLNPCEEDVIQEADR